MSKKISTNSNQFSMSIEENLPFFLNKIQDLTQIDDKILIKFNNDTILMYSKVGKGENIHAFKSHIINKEEIFSKSKSEFETPVKYILRDAKKFYKSINSFTMYNEDVVLKLIYDEYNFGEKLQFKNSVFSKEFIGGDPILFKEDLDIEQIKETMDVNNSLFSFKLTEEKFKHLKRESSLDNENDVYSIVLKDKEVFIGEKSWKLKIDENIEGENNKLTFPKKYFNTINFDKNCKEITINVFDMFIMVSNENTNLLITVELTI